MDYQTIVNWIDIALVLALIFFCCFLWYYFLFFASASKRPKLLPKALKYARFAVLIPARNESKVIRNILTALSKQNYPRDYFEVFVIVESEDDPTVEITKSFGFKVVVRKNLENRRTKGFALDDAYQEIKRSEEHFDAFMIFDADNVMAQNYLSLMNDVYQAGYQVGVGYRSFTNATKNWVCGCSATLFSFMNQFTSKGRSLFFEKATLTGTGYFIVKEIVDNEGGWIWNGMTEDVQLTTYCYYHNVRMHYYPFAKYFDEQPDKFRTLNKQHVRWLWGFFASRKTFKKNTNVYPIKSKAKRTLALIEYNSSIYPFIIYTVITFLCSLASFGLFIASCFEAPEYSGWLLAHAIFQFSILYLIFIFISAFTIAIDNKNLKFSASQCITICLTYIAFFSSFVLALFDGLFHKNKRTNWTTIEHTGHIIDHDALESENGKRK